MSESSTDVRRPRAGLHVAIVRARYNPAGGAERFVQRALAALAARGVTLTVIARDWPAVDPAGAAANGGADAIELHFERVDPFYLGSVWRDASFAAGVRRRLARQHFDLVQSHERIPGLPVYRAGDGVHAAFLKRRARGLSAWRRLGIALNPYHRWMLRTERQMFEHPALRRVICNSTMVRDEIAAHFAIDPTKLRVIRNGVDTAHFQPATPAQRGQALAALGIEPGRFVIAYVGSGFERKGLAAAIRALAEPAAPAVAILLVAGTDRAWRRYEAMAGSLGVADRVRFLGAVSDVRSVLHAARAFVLPTIYDPFPNAVLEAMACGLPTVTSTGSGAAEIIEPGRSGFVTDVRDAGAIADALARIADEARWPMMSAAARAAVEPMTLARMGAELIELYRELVLQPVSGPDPR